MVLANLVLPANVAVGLGVAVGIIIAAAIVGIIVIWTKYQSAQKNAAEKEKYISALLTEVEVERTETMSKMDFILKMSHDIRVPISSVKGYGEIGLKALTQGDTAKAEKSLHKIDSSADYIIKILDDASELYTSDIDFVEDSHADVVDIEQWCRDIDSEISSLSNSVKFVSTCENMGSETFRIDKEKLTELFDVIFKNAVKFSKAGSVITLDIKKGQRTKNIQHIAFAMTETAQDIPNTEFMTMVLNPYVLDEEEMGEKAGHLGATMIKAWVSKLKGEISVANLENGGCACDISLPFEVDGEQEETVAEDKVYDFTGKTALVVEDNEINREIACEIMKMAGFKVESACDGNEAIEKFCKSSVGYYDVILMDIIMQSKNGWETTMEIRSLDRKDAKNVVIIAMTGNVFDDDIRRSIESGMNGHIKKPIDNDTLFGELQQHLS